MLFLYACNSAVHFWLIMPRWLAVQWCSPISLHNEHPYCIHRRGIQSDLRMRSARPLIGPEWVNNSFCSRRANRVHGPSSFHKIATAFKTMLNLTENLPSADLEYIPVLSTEVKLQTEYCEVFWQAAPAMNSRRNQRNFFPKNGSWTARGRLWRIPIAISNSWKTGE